MEAAGVEPASEKARREKNYVHPVCMLTSRPLYLDGRYQFVLRRKRLNNLSASMTGVGFLLDFHEPERCQDLDISPHCGAVPFENYSKVRNWRRLFANRADHSDSLRCQYAK